MPAPVEVRQLTKRFGNVWALRGIDLSLSTGRVLGLLGPNGAGKSTFIKILAGVQRPTAGQVMLMGLRPGLETKRHVAYLPEVDHIYPAMTPQRAITFMGTFFEDFDDDRATQLFDALKVPGRQTYGALSRGQRARFKLAITLARQAPLLLLDEPLAGVDVVSRDHILSTILGEYRTENQAIILATHEIGEAEALFDEVIFLDEGKAVLSGAADDLRAQRGKSVEGIYREVFA